MKPRTRSSRLGTFDQNLTIQEVRLVADLRIMHSKVDELYQLVEEMKRRHSEIEVHKYADGARLAEDTRKVDEIYLWFVKLKEERNGRLSRAKLREPARAPLCQLTPALCSSGTVLFPVNPNHQLRQLMRCNCHRGANHNLRIKVGIRIAPDDGPLMRSVLPAARGRGNMAACFPDSSRSAC